MTPTQPIAVYGATGYTGRLVAAELRRRELPFVLCGRDPDKLRPLAAALGSPEVRTAAVGDRDALRHAFGDCAAVINCAGPFTVLGEPVVRAAVETGTHYVDTAGEQPFIKLVADRYDEAARAAEVAVIPAMGFDYVPGDLLCRVVARDHEPADDARPRLRRVRVRGHAGHAALGPRGHEGRRRGLARRRLAAGGHRARCARASCSRRRSAARSWPATRAAE